MPNIKSAKKRVKIASIKNLRNKMAKSTLKTAMKRFETAVASGDKETAAKAYTAAVKKLDRAAVKGILHKNNAARKKSQYTVKLNTLNAQ